MYKIRDTWCMYLKVCIYNFEQCIYIFRVVEVLTSVIVILSDGGGGNHNYNSGEIIITMAAGIMVYIVMIVAV